MIGIFLLAAAVAVVDGDTIRLDGERVRLIGIDAPEIHGCPKGRACAPGDGQASKRSLQNLMNGPISIRRVGYDRYGRTLAHIYVNGVNVACEQIGRGQAVYMRKWDNGLELARECR